MGTFSGSVCSVVCLGAGIDDVGDTSDPGLGVSGASVATGDEISSMSGAAGAAVAAGGSGTVTGAGISPLGFWTTTSSTSSGLNSLLRRLLRRLADRASLGDLGELSSAGVWDRENRLLSLRREDGPDDLVLISSFWASALVASMTGWQGGRQDDGDMHRGCESVSGAEGRGETLVVDDCDFSPDAVLDLSFEVVEGRERG